MATFKLPHGSPHGFDTAQMRAERARGFMLRRKRLSGFLPCAAAAFGCDAALSGVGVHIHR